MNIGYDGDKLVAVPSTVRLSYQLSLMTMSVSYLDRMNTLLVSSHSLLLIVTP